MKNNKDIPGEIKDFLDETIEKKTKEIERDLKKVIEKNPSKVAVLSAALERFNSDPYASAIDLLLGWSPKEGTWGAPKVMVGTHLGKFISPSSRVAVLYDAGASDDGYVHTGNYPQMFDSSQDARFSPTGRFMLIEVNGKPMFMHIKDKDEIARALCDLTEDPEKTLDAFRAIIEPVKASLFGMKQVHFPVEDGFHLLSPLNSTGMFALVDALENAGAIMKNREKYNEFKERTEKKRITVNNMWVFHYGSTKPQNISVLNQNNGGDVFMLPSFPPVIEKRDIKIPKNDFFSDCICASWFNTEFKKLNKGILIKHNNKKIRELPLDVVKDISSRMSIYIEMVRNEIENLDYEPDMNIPDWQNDMFEEKDGWFDDFAHALAVWIHNSYKKLFGVVLGDYAIEQFEKAIHETEEEFK